MDLKEQKEILASSQDRTETGQTNSNREKPRFARNHQDYWKAKLKRRNYRSRDGGLVEIPEWQVRMFHQGKETWFNLGTANRAAAAIKARDIYMSMISVGWDATFAKYKPDPTVSDEVCTVGEFLADVAKRSHIKPVTLRRYSVKLRKIVADIAGVNAGRKVKGRLSKYDYVNGGNKAWRATVDGQSLAILTPEAITAWRNSYVATRSSEPTTRISAERSAASTIRCSRALFTGDVTNMLHVKLPPNPFSGVKLKDPGPQRYHSDINPEWLLKAAATELTAKEPKIGGQEYLALNLCLWAGLRRKEADLLTWKQVDLQNGHVHVRRTPYFEPKTEESQRIIDIPSEAVEVIRAFKEGSHSEFVLDGSDARPAATYDYYRADSTWRTLTAWLKSKGVRERKAIHMLRKESGSLMASRFGIEAAREHLGHRDIRTTSAHYVSKKGRREVSLTAGGTGNQMRVI